MVRQWQGDRIPGRYSHSYMDALPNFVKLAEAYGHVGMLIEKPRTWSRRCARAQAQGPTVFWTSAPTPPRTCSPMVQAGKGITEMLLGSEDL